MATSTPCDGMASGQKRSAVAAIGSSRSEEHSSWDAAETGAA